MSTWPPFSSSRLRKKYEPSRVVSGGHEVAWRSGCWSSFGIIIAAQRVCCEQTVLLVSASRIRLVNVDVM